MLWRSAWSRNSGIQIPQRLFHVTPTWQRTTCIFQWSLEREFMYFAGKLVYLIVRASNSCFQSTYPKSTRMTPPVMSYDLCPHDVNIYNTGIRSFPKSRNRYRYCKCSHRVDTTHDRRCNFECSLGKWIISLIINLWFFSLWEDPNESEANM